MDWSSILPLVIPFLLENWIFFVAACLLGALGSLAKKYAPDPAASRFWSIFYQTLPWHPMFVGIFLGLFAFMPLPASVASLGGIVGSLYYGGAGFFSVWGYDVIKTFIKYKYKKSKE